ncbi:hypothetical protein [Acinetobacter shaoyimingii]|uniref:Uncharacterized protein n=1 Tax=Acinetobacter shaoyimingii TaxID=2715164 RepID=A0A6G8RV13_9GAMM|nr:hypothetical protein [Acinetobacter shaoyimingii]NHB59510.1 hypothetical protein [Acinetobacter shaoyimingii]QIO05779.1 hypothetical protein G8E00_07365 [Acinetobacter shaoyimingii]
MSNTIDGFNFDLPPVQSQVAALAQHHRKLLDEAIFHQEIHLGNYCLAQRKRVYDFTRTLDPDQKSKFYDYYDGELRRIADDDELHPPHAEAGVSVFAIVLALGIIAAILYFSFIQPTVS